MSQIKYICYLCQWAIYKNLHELSKEFNFINAWLIVKSVLWPIMYPKFRKTLLSRGKFMS